MSSFTLAPDVHPLPQPLKRGQWELDRVEFGGILSRGQLLLGNSSGGPYGHRYVTSPSQLRVVTFPPGRSWDEDAKVNQCVLCCDIYHENPR